MNCCLMGKLLYASVLEAQHEDPASCWLAAPEIRCHQQTLEYIVEVVVPIEEHSDTIDMYIL